MKEKHCGPIKTFDFDRPTLPRVVTIMFFNWVVGCLSIAHSALY
jgi:hypothetical protein